MQMYISVRIRRLRGSQEKLEPPKVTPVFMCVLNFSAAELKACFQAKAGS